MEILTYPIGLVVGMLPVIANLGPQGSAPAQLLLDGRPACVMTVEAPKCTVDLGGDLRVHLLELVRSDARGAVTERTTRWVNRPGAQAEVYLRGGCEKDSGECTVTIGWGHPAKLEPLSLTVTLDGKPILREVRHEVRFRAEQGSDRVVSVDVIFPDGRRASQTRALGAGYVGFAETGLQPVPVVPQPGAQPPLSIGGLPLRGIEDASAEVAFVVEPLALEALRGLWTKAWSEIRVPGRPLGLQVNGELIYLEAMTVVVPNEHLNRFDIFQLRGGRDAWLSKMAYGSSALEGKGMRLADAVASAGVLVAGSPRKRAVVLVISGRHRDESVFTPEQVSRYLAEIMVPLVVWRVEEGVGKEWPEGPRVSSKTILPTVKGLRAGIDAQRIAWVEGGDSPGSLRPREDERGVVIAGRAGVLGPAVAATAAPAQETAQAPPPPAPTTTAGRTIQGRVDVTAVRVLIRPETRDGGSVPDLAPYEIEVLEDGAPAKVLGLDRLGTVAEAPKPGVPVEVPVPELVPWSLVIYVVPDLCTRPGLVNILARLWEDAPRLVSFGSVTVVLANPLPKVLASRITSRAALEEVLESDTFRSVGPSRLVQIRRDFLTSIASPSNKSVSESYSESQAKAAVYLAKVARAQAAFMEERHTLRDVFSRMVAWSRTEKLPGAKVLFLAVDGFDLNPDEFYLEAIDPSGQAARETAEYQRVAQAFRSERLGPFVQEQAAELAEQGWTATTFDNGIVALAGWAGSAEQTGHGQLKTFVDSGATSGGPSFMFLHPKEALQSVSETTGGVIVPPGGKLRGALDTLGHTLMLTYQVERPADGRSHKVEVSCTRPGVVVTAPKLVVSGTAQGESELHARRVLEGDRAQGGLPVTLSLIATDKPVKGGGRSGELRVRVDMSGVKDVLALLGKARMRVTVAVEITGSEPFVAHQEAEADATQEGTAWAYTAPLNWPREAKQVAVVVEELATRAWGASRMDLPGAQ